MTDDAEGKDFPWRPKKAIDILPGPLVSKDKEINWSDVTEDVIGLYFSAHWVSGDWKTMLCCLEGVVGPHGHVVMHHVPLCVILFVGSCCTGKGMLRDKIL